MSDLTNTFYASVSQIVRVRVLFAALAFLFCLSAAKNTFAANFVVTRTDDRNTTCNSGVDCSLREAVNAANAAPTNDTINFAIPAGNAGCTSGVCTITLTLGELVVNSAGTLTITNSTGASNLLISGNNTSRVFYLNLFANLTISGVTITKGNGTGTTDSRYNGSGGGIYITNGTLTLTDSIVSGNTAGFFGGGIYTLHSTTTLTNSTVSGNTSRSSGGGLETAGSGTLTLTNSTVNGNMSESDGGGIYNTITLTLTNSTVSGNTSGSGSVQGDGGGINNNGSSTLTLTNSTVSGNTADGGGGIMNFTTSTLTNSTVSGNIADGDGGIFNGGTLNLTSVTVTKNSSTMASCPFCAGGINNFGTAGRANLKNTIVAVNTVANAASSPDFRGAVAAGSSFNLIGNGKDTTGITNGTNSNQVGASASPIDPKLGALANNGGATQTHALLFGSPAIDKGDSFGLTTDQRGFTRPFDFPSIPNAAGGDGSDIGAFERRSTDVNRSALFDYDGDGKADVSVFRPSSGGWYLQNSSSGFYGVSFGAPTDRIVPADYDGDGKTDIAVWRENPNNPDRANFYILNSRDGALRTEQFGRTGDSPTASADYDGDGKADPGVYRAGTGGGQSFFFYKPSTQPTVDFISAAWGIAGDKPVAADYDGDGKADIAVYRPSNGVWYIARSGGGFSFVQFGAAADKPVVGDYDGDGRADQAVFRPENGTWYISRSTLGFSAIQFGISTDLPAPADYDGDGKTDIAVFRSANGGNWYINGSSIGFTAIQFGMSGDKPTPNAFVP